MSKEFLDFIKPVYRLFIVFLLINKKFDVISFTNGYTDELVIKIKRVNPGFFFLIIIFHRALGISLQWKTLLKEQ